MNRAFHDFNYDEKTYLRQIIIYGSKIVNHAYFTNSFQYNSSIIFAIYGLY